MVVPWLRLRLSRQGAWVRSLVGELRSCMPYGVAKEKKKKRAGGKSEEEQGQNEQGQSEIFCHFNIGTFIYFGARNAER